MPNEDAPGVERHFPLVWSLVNRLGITGAEREEFFAAGCLGLVKAWKRYDPRLGTAFSTYAVPVILGELRRQLQGSRGVRVPRSTRDLVLRARATRARLAQERGGEPTLAEVAAALGVGAADLVAAEEACLPPRSLEAEPLMAMAVARAEAAPDEGMELSLALGQLEPRERAVIRGRYFDDLTQQEVAARLGISQSQVCRLEQKALDHLRALLGGHSPGRLRDKLVAAKEAESDAGGKGARTGGQFS